MKRHSYGKLIGMSWSWMIQMLFRPLSLKKWIYLGVIILLAGQMGGGGGCNVNLKGGDGNFNKMFEKFQQTPVTAGSPVEAQSFPESIKEIIASQDGAAIQVPSFLQNRQTVILVVAVGGIIVLLASVFMLLWIWLASNFSFVFIDSVLKNDASFRVPFHRNKYQGNSYFRWNILFSTAIFLVFAAIIA